MQRLLLSILVLFILQSPFVIQNSAFAAQALVPETGQTSSYGTRDDGALRPGVAWPNPRFNNNGNGTITDNLTGLIWLQNANCTDIAGGIAKATGYLTWANALTWSNNLAAGKCNISDGSAAGDWRLPNAKELESLVDLQNSNPSLPTGHPFSGVVNSYYWSSSSYAVNTGYAWVVYMGNGVVGYDGKGSSNYVWPVRGGQSGALGSLIISTVAPFPATMPGNIASKNVTVSSTLPTPATIGAASVVGANAADFSLGDSCSGQTLSENGSCAITVNFTPRSCGSKSATLTVPTSAGGLTTQISGIVCGTGTATLLGNVLDANSRQTISTAVVKVGPSIVTAGETGYFSAPDLPTGTLDILVTKSGYDAWQGSVTLKPQQTFRRDIYLKPSIGGQRVTSVTSKYSTGKQYYFLPGVDFTVDAFTAQIDWGGKTPGKVRFITSKHSYDVTATGTSATLSNVNIGTEFDPCATLQVIAIAADNSQSPLKNADFIVTKALPVDPAIPILTNNLSVEDSGSSFSYVNNSTLSKGLLDQTIGDYKNMPILGGVASVLRFAPEFDFEFTGDEGKASYNLALFKNAEFAGIYSNEYTKRKEEHGLKNLFRAMQHRFSEGKFDRRHFPSAAIAGFDLTLFPDAKIETTFNPNSCGTSSSGWEDVTGYGGVAGAGKWSVTYQGITPTAVPIPYYIKGAIGMEFDAMLNINELNDLKLAGTIATNPYISGTLGAGVNGVIAVEGTAKGGVDVDWSLPVPSGQNAITGCTAYLSVTGRAYALMLEYPFPTKRWDVDCLPSNTSGAPAVQKLLSSSSSSQDSVVPSLISRDYLYAPNSVSFRPAPQYTVKQYSSTGQAYSVASSPIVSGTFPVSSANLSSAGSNVNLLWLTDNPARSAMNRTMLQYSTFDGTNWSAPVAIADNGTADFSPVSLTFADGSVVAAWEDVKTVMADTATLDEMAAQLEVAAAIYDPVAKTWGSAVRLTNNTTLDRSPRLAGKTKNNLMLTWIANSQNNLSGSATKPNNLYYAMYNGTSWSTPQIAAAVPNNIKRYSTVYDGTTANVALALDTDDNSETIEDLELYRLTYTGGAWSALTRLTTDSVIDDNPQLALDTNNDVVMIWVKGSELSSVVNFNFANRTVIRTEESYGSSLADFKLANSTDGKVAVIYGDRTETSTADLFTVFYDPIFNLWGAPKQLTSDPETEMRPSIAFMGTDTIVSVFNRKLLINPDGTPTTGALTDLYMLKHTMGIDLALEAGSLTVDPANAAPGSSVTISVNAQNLGDKVAQNIPINFYNGDPAVGGLLIGTATITGAFKPGEVKTVSITWTIPASNVPFTIFAVIDPAATVDTLNRGNNVISSSLALPDLQLQVIRWEKVGSGKYQLIIPVTNIGGTASPTSNLTLRLGSQTGEVLTTIPVAALDRFASVDYVYTFDNSVRQLPGFTIVATIDEARLIQETDKYNNSASVVIKPETAVLAVSVSGSGGGNVTSDPQGTNPAGVSCTSGICTTTFPYGTIVNLLKTPDIYSLFNGWSVDCTGVAACTLAMVGPKAVTSTFNLAPKIKLDVNAATGYGNFTDAYTNATGALHSLQDVLTGDWTLNGGKAIVLKGGYQADYLTRTGYTTIKGKLTINNGSLRVDRVKVE